jgi:HSP20 family protein
MATIVKWSPLRELDWMERGMRRMFEDFGLAPTVVPAANVYETKDEFVVEVEVPGFKEKELGIEVTDHTLVVKASRASARRTRRRKRRKSSVSTSGSRNGSSAASTCRPTPTRRR